MRRRKVRDLRLPRTVHVFLISYVARTFHDLFRLLAARTDLRLYTLNPCRELWEDVGQQKEGDDPFGLGLGPDPAPLRLWGRPGRENVRLLNELADCDFVDAFVEPAGDTLLSSVQSDILRREPAEV